MKGLKFILILIIIVNIVLITYMTVLVKPIQEYTYEEYRISVEGENPELEAALKIGIFPEGREVIEEIYDGNIDLNYFYEKLFDLVHTNLPKIKDEIKDLSVNMLNDYLQNNKNNMIAYMGITNIEQLSKLENNIKGCNIEDSEYINCNIIDNTYIESEKYDSFKLIINYKTCKLNFIIYIANDMLSSPMIIFEPITGGEV